jgi:hypothetical protein
MSFFLHGGETNKKSKQEVGINTEREVIKSGNLPTP